MAEEAKPSADQIALELSKLTGADLPATLAILSGILQGIREGSTEAEIAAARFAVDALRLECDKWRRPPARNDQLKALREAGAAAAKK